MATSKTIILTLLQKSLAYGCIVLCVPCLWRPWARPHPATNVVFAKHLCYYCMDVTIKKACWWHEDEGSCDPCCLTCPHHSAISCIALSRLPWPNPNTWHDQLAIQHQHGSWHTKFGFLLSLSYYKCAVVCRMVFVYLGWCEVHGNA